MGEPAMSCVRDVLDHKGYGVETIDDERTVFEAIRTMDEHGIGSLVVTRHDQIVGMLTERDYLRKVALRGRTSRTTVVRDIMSTPVLTVTPTTSIDESLAIMTAARARQLPVLQDGLLVGIVSIGDFVEWRLCQQDCEIAALVEYIQTGAALWKIPHVTLTTSTPRRPAPARE
jgi:CBS domain-containing protein